jgi:Spy/CpxP family protein refolding chaperone
MKRIRIVVAVLLALGCAIALAQAPGPDPIAENIFPPDLIVQQQQAIGLTDSQKEFLRAEVRQAQSKLMDLQWQLSDEVEKLAAMLKQDTVDDQRVGAQLDRVLNLERDIKRTQLGMVVRIKNKLTHEQQVKLREIRAKSGAK